MPSTEFPHPEEWPATASRGAQDGNAAADELLLAWHAWDELTTARLYELLQFRQAIFVVEQASPYPDLDGRDGEARHLTVRRDGALIGYLRLIAPSKDDVRPLVRIGRLAVALDERGNHHARLMMNEALRVAAELYPANDIEIGAQTYLEDFYRSFGFTPSSSPYDDFGVPHIDLVL
ncbi:MAG TPA: GNAT family N-acetyltransferase, partial [Stellaceae bacterium]|nr:GNAT family N-acetyltransferase [Stellaceae bacterium]